MLFCSEEFIFQFLPVFLVIYYMVAAKYRNLVLFLGSLWFYFSGEKKWFPLILISLTLHYVVTRRMQGKPVKQRRQLLIAALCYDFGILFFFKYVPFLMQEWNRLADWLLAAYDISFFRMPQLTVTLPLGISFYTFQIAAYVIDVYRRPAEYEKDYVSLGSYLCMFPQLIAGPIVLFRDVSEQMRRRRINLQRLEQGVKLFVVGLGYKMLLANILGNLWHEIQVVGIESISTSMAWMGAAAYTLQLYFDFNGYSLMAMGLGEMLGFRIPRNFRQPYMAESVTEFWRRWHITLSTWFREYLYIPLGGNRRGTGRMILNLLIVWSLTGIWHGAGWNFLLWGLYYFVLLILEKLYLHKVLEKHRIVGHIYTILAFTAGWIIFALENISDIGIYLNKMFLWMGQPDAWIAYPHITLDALRRYGLFFAAAIVCATSLPEKLYRKYHDKMWFLAVLLGIFWASVHQIMTAVNNPFLYFRF